MLDMSTQLVLFSQIAISNRYIAMGHPQYFHIMIHVLPVLLIIPECGSIMIYPDLAPQKKHVPVRRTPPDLDEIATAHQLIHGTLVMANPGKKNIPSSSLCSESQVL
jgi:hypothetical protein